LARHLKIFGVLGFWTQLCLGLIAALLLVFRTSSSYYEEYLPSLSYGFSCADGIAWAYIALGVLALTVIGFYSCLLLARPLKRGELPEGGVATVKRLISKFNFGNALGLTLALEPRAPRHGQGRTSGQRREPALRAHLGERKGGRCPHPLRGSVYCARGDMENRIKEQPTRLRSSRPADGPRARRRWTPMRRRRQ
jgi:hypothetical protein